MPMKLGLPTLGLLDGSGAPVVNNAILQEDGFTLLLEDGSGYLLLE